MVMVNSDKRMVVFIRVNGKMNNKTAMELKNGVMAADIKVISHKTRKTELEYINLLTVKGMQATGGTTQ